MKLGIVKIDLTLIDDDDDEIEVLPPVSTGPPARQASIPLPAQPRSEVPLRSTAPPQRQEPSRPPPPPEVIELDDDDDDVVEILAPSYRPPPRVDIAPRSEPLGEPLGGPIQDEPMLDLNDLSLGERPPTPPPPEFPSFAKRVDASKHHFEPMEGAPRPGPSLPPALRTRNRTALGQRMQDIVSSDKLVQNLGLKGLKAMGWKTEKRERIASVEPPVIPTWARPANDKGKGRDPGEPMKVILVVGATGQQGNAVIRTLSSSEDYFCLALTRDLESPRAQRLKSFKNLKLVSGNLNDIEQLRVIFEDAKSTTTGTIWGVFVALAFPGLGKSAEEEEKQGKVS
ncbi:unnamed protein product [Rhizoctonia solani]|uniref:NmrA-like domain-containing protein n=1 Tax=Rhizoctonia solani TaxID=456999 RepID=A0A8H3CGD1_9AGAM|nr:unnamed protein product [Rhizoctonia solani]